MGLSDGGSLSGQFAFTQDAATRRVQVSATDVSARLGDPTRGASLSLSNGTLSMDSGPDGYTLQASGVGTLQGAAGSQFTGTLGVVANAQGQHFEARGAQLSVDGLGTVQGDFAFTTRREETADSVAQELLVGVRSLAAELRVGEAALAARGGWLALVMRSTTPLTGTGVASSDWALAAQTDVSVTVDSTLTLTGEQVSLRLNPGALMLAREVPTTGERLVLDLPAGVMQIAGRFHAAIDGVADVTGELVLDVSRTTRLLSDGREVRLQEFALSGSGVTARLGTGAGAGMDAVASGAEMALVYARDVDSSRSWLTTRGSMASLSVAGYRLDALDQAEWALNRAASAAAQAEGTTLDWGTTRAFVLGSGRRFVMDQVGEVCTLPVQGRLQVGDSSVEGRLAFTLDRPGRFWQIDASAVEVLLAAGPALVRLSQGSGQLRLNADRSRSGSLAGLFGLSGVAGLTMSGEGAARFGADGELALAGQASIDIAGFGGLSGAVSVARRFGADGAPQLLIGAADVSATVAARPVGCR
jgi:hypothetical protein